MVKRVYQQPILVEFGRIDQLTLGSGGHKPDFSLDPGPGLKLINNICDASDPAWGCLMSGP